MKDDDWWEFGYLEPVLDELVRLSKEANATKQPCPKNGKKKSTGNRD